MANDENIWLCEGLGTYQIITGGTVSVVWLEQDKCTSNRASLIHSLPNVSGRFNGGMKIKFTVTKSAPLGISNNLKYVSELASIMQAQIDSLTVKITALEKQLSQ